MDAFFCYVFPSLPVLFICCFLSFLHPSFSTLQSHLTLTSLIHNVLPINDVATPSPSPTLIRATADRVTPGSGGSSGSDPAPVPGPVPSAPRDVVASLVSTRFIKLTWRLPLEPHGDDITYSVYYGLESTKR